MSLSKEMQSRINKINSLTKQDFSISVFNYWVKIRDPHGNDINWRSQGNEKLPGLSPIALILGPFVATQIRDWKYFELQFYWLFLTRILCEIFLSGYNINSILYISFVYFIWYYSQLYPFKRYKSENNFKEISPILSIPIGLMLMLLIHGFLFLIFGTFYFDN